MKHQGRWMAGIICTPLIIWRFFASTSFFNFLAWVVLIVGVAVLLVFAYERLPEPKPKAPAPIDPNREKHIADWKGWEAIHHGQPAKRRMERARRGKLIQKDFDLLNGSARFLGRYRDEYYSTTLNNCTCPDFEEQQAPCKHMYKLAEMMQLIDFDKYLK